mmetsp:Transcript_54268/g.104907  ORF Transcript_54268/g.104907 Transcript_54268/m.104907 type:complete len:255 (+) Transcript_54268:510-1274(+)
MPLRANCAAAAAAAEAATAGGTADVGGQKPPVPALEASSGGGMRPLPLSLQGRPLLSTCLGTSLPSTVDAKRRSSASLAISVSEVRSGVGNACCTTAGVGVLLRDTPFRWGGALPRLSERRLELALPLKEAETCRAMLPIASSRRLESESSENEWSGNASACWDLLCTCSATPGEELGLSAVSYSCSGSSAVRPTSSPITGLPPIPSPCPPSFVHARTAMSPASCVSAELASICARRSTASSTRDISRFSAASS